MGVLNVTPDSFSDGGEFFDRAKAIEHGQAMAAAGADIIDVGGESTRPGSEPVALDDELKRVVPVVTELNKSVKALISIDTAKAEVARAAIDAGASLVNDVTAGRNDPGMFPLVARTKAAMILMHMQGEPRTMQAAPAYDDVVSEVAIFFRQQYGCALECGIDPMAIAFDPGIGFGKTLEHNLALLRSLMELRVENRPVVVGVSRKSSLAKLMGSEAREDRVNATVALTALLRPRGGDVFRVHDVAQNVQALRVSEALGEA